MVVDGAKFIRSSIAAVQEDLILGGILAVVVVLIFLRNVRSTLVSAVALPTAIIGTFAVMKALGFTFNIVTMLALTLSHRPAHRRRHRGHREHRPPPGARGEPEGGGREGDRARSRWRCSR